MNENWNKVEGTRAARILKEIGADLMPVAFSSTTTALRAQKLNFWNGYEILELTDFSLAVPARKFAIYGGGEVRMIDWTHRPIYAVNAIAPLVLNAETVFEYVRFFFDYVRGRQGRFQIAEAADDIRWQVEPPPTGRRALQKMISPLQIVEKQEDGGFTLQGFMIFKNNLFKTHIEVTANGVLDLKDEEIMIEGIPVLHDLAA